LSGELQRLCSREGMNDLAARVAYSETVLVPRDGYVSATDPR